MVTVLKCRHCSNTFMIDLEVEKINTALLQTCPDCLEKMQKGESLPDEYKSEENTKETQKWF